MSELLIDGTMVVFEGVQRLNWRRTGQASWVVSSVWPRPQRQQALLSSLQQGMRVLVVLAPERTRTVMFEEELPGADAQVGMTISAGPASGLVDVEVDPLDWLPEEDRTRGLTFENTVRHLSVTRPALALPRLIADDEWQDNLRFACATAPVTPEHSRLLEPFLNELFQEDGVLDGQTDRRRNRRRSGGRLSDHRDAAIRRLRGRRQRQPDAIAPR